MLTELSPTLTHSTVAVKPDELLLQKGSWVRFTKAWGQDQAWAADKTFEVVNDPLVVKYPISRKVPTGHYADLDLSNLVNPVGGTMPAINASFSWQMYPVQTYNLYQISVGFKRGDYFVQTYIPASKFIYTVGASVIYPDMNSTIWRYLGAKYPKDSPAESPVWYLYTMWNMVPIILRLYCDGPDYDKMTLEFKINKCQLAEINLRTVAAQLQMDTADLRVTSELKRIHDKALLLPYYTEMVGY
jgi:hypothetical protein